MSKLQRKPKYVPIDGVEQLVQARPKEKEVTALMHELRDNLKQLGVSYSDNDTESQLALKVSSELKKIISEPAKSKEMSDEALKRWAGSTNITDVGLLRNIYKAGIPAFYVRLLTSARNPGGMYLFHDQDRTISSKDIQLRVRKCGFNHMDLQRTLAKYSVQPQINHDGVFRG